MSLTPVILAVVSDETLPTAAIGRAVELARRSGGVLHLCSFVHDPLIETAEMRPNAEIAVHGRRALLEERAAALRALAQRYAGEVAEIRHEALWAAEPCESILAKAISVSADYVVKDVGRESTLSRLLFTPLDWKLVRLLPCKLMLVGLGAASAIGRVLAAVDALREEGGREGLNRQILRVARELSGYHDAALDLASVAPAMTTRSGAPLGIDPLLDRVLARHTVAFETLVRDCGIAAERAHQLVGAPAERIAALARSIRADLVVIGNVYHGPLERLLLGSTAEVLMQLLQCDLVVVKRPDFVDTLARHVDLARIDRDLRLSRPDRLGGELA